MKITVITLTYYNDKGRRVDYYTRHRRLNADFCCDEMHGALDISKIVEYDETKAEVVIRDRPLRRGYPGRAYSIRFCPWCGSAIAIVTVEEVVKDKL